MCENRIRRRKRVRPLSLADGLMCRDRSSQERFEPRARPRKESAARGRRAAVRRANRATAGAIARISFWLGQYLAGNKANPYGSKLNQRIANHDGAAVVRKMERNFARALRLRSGSRSSPGQFHRAIESTVLTSSNSPMTGSAAKIGTSVCRAKCGAAAQMIRVGQQDAGDCPAAVDSFCKRRPGRAGSDR